jgi:phage baseplate assembly protein W
MASFSDISRGFLGNGWNYPLGQRAGHTALAQHEESIRQAIRIILLTNPGERVMRPDFGAGLNDFLFEPVTPGTMKALETRVNEALIDFEPRIDVISVAVTAPDSTSGRVLIDINYRVRSSNAVANLVYPFYLGEGPA